MLRLIVLAVLLTVPAGSGAQEPARATPESAARSTESRAALPPPGYLEACLKLVRQGRYAEARARLAPVVADHPGWSRAQFFLGLSYHEEQRYEQARDLFRKALELDPQAHEIRVFYGWSLYYMGEMDAAREMFESYRIVKPGYADAVFALGLIDFDDDDVESAGARFRETIRLAQQQQNRSTEAKARARLADVLVRNDDWEKAKVELERSIALKPDNYETYFKLSRVLQRLGDAEGAERARRKHREILQSKHPNPAPMGGNPR